MSSGESLCFQVPSASPGDVAVINVTNTEVTANGWGALRPSDATPVYGRPAASQYSSVNFAAGTAPNPNLAMVEVGPDGEVCYDHGRGSSNVILDLSALVRAGTAVAIDPTRLLDTRDDHGPLIGGTGLCVFVPGSYPGDMAVLNITNTEVTANGWGAVNSYDAPAVYDLPPANQYSSVNFAAGTAPNPNLATALVGTDGYACYEQGRGTSNVILDLSAVILMGNAIAIEPLRLIDTRNDTIPPPAGSFAPGQYLVGSQLAAGRYVMDATPGCAWERLSGLNGTADEIIASDFRFVNSRMIVDIAATDVLFRFGRECSPMRPYSSSTALADTIPPGSHVVGEHIRPGTYVTAAAAECYWERVTGFGGTIDEVIDNMFTNVSGQQTVTILASDEGFMAYGECGTWSRI